PRPRLLPSGTASTPRSRKPSRTCSRRASGADLALAALDERLVAVERLVPLAADDLERAPRVVEPVGLELPKPLAAALEVAHHTRVGEHAQVLGDALAADVGAGGEAGDRERAARAQERDEPEPRRIAQRREDARERLAALDDALHARIALRSGLGGLTRRHRRRCSGADRPS